VPVPHDAQGFEQGIVSSTQPSLLGESEGQRVFERPVGFA